MPERGTEIHASSSARLSEREVAILGVLSDKDASGGMYAGRVGTLAGFARSGRIDAGTTKTLDALERKGLARSRYDSTVIVGGTRSVATGRRWFVTAEGRQAYGEWAFSD